MLPAAQALHAGGRFLAAADHAVRILPALAEKQIDEVGAVVDHDIGMAAERFHPKPARFLIGRSVDRIDRDAVIHQSRADRILGGQAIGAGHMQLGAAARKRFG